MRRFSQLLIAFALLTTTSLAQTNPVISPYVAYLDHQNQSAKDYILGLFNNHDVVIICERFHPEITQYDLVSDILADKRFIDKVGNLFTEVGASTLQAPLDSFLQTPNLPPQEVNARLLYLQRNCSFWPLWSNKNYYYYLQKVYALNNSLPPDKALHLYPSDLPFSWSGANSASLLHLKEMIGNRDSLIAARVIANLDGILHSSQPRKKALVIMNYRHAFGPEFRIRGIALHNVAYFLFQHYGARTANVMLNTLALSNDGQTPLVQQGKWDAAFSFAHKENLGFDFKDAPFGKDSFDLWPYPSGFTYKDVFTGFAFYLPLEKHRLVEGFPGLVDDSFRPELLRRIDLAASLGGEFAKVADMKKPLLENSNLFNTEENRNYYQLDSLLVQRARWLK